MEKGTMIDHVVLTLEQRVAAYYKSQGYVLPLYDPSLLEASESAYIDLTKEMAVYDIDGVKVWHDDTLNENVYVYEANPDDFEGEKCVFFMDTNIATLYGHYTMGVISDLLLAETDDVPYPFYLEQGTPLENAPLVLPGVSGKPYFTAYKDHVFVGVHFVDGSRWVGSYKRCDALADTLEDYL